MGFPIATVMHPTDFSDVSANAFAHALKISLIVKAKLYIMSVAERADVNSWEDFPHVRQTLAQWGLVNESVTPFVLAKKLGIEIVKAEIDPQDPVEGFRRFFSGHQTDLLVLATHGREGLSRWLRPSVAEAMSRRSRACTLFLSPHCSGFVDQTSGAMKLKHVLVPIDHAPPAGPAFRAIQQFCRSLTGADVEFHTVHVGTETPSLVAEEKSGRPVKVELRGWQCYRKHPSGCGRHQGSRPHCYGDRRTSWRPGCRARKHNGASSPPRAESRFSRPRLSQSLMSWRRFVWRICVENTAQNQRRGPRGVRRVGVGYGLRRRQAVG